MSKGSDTQTVTTEAQIPSFLQPFLRQSTGAAGSSLANLRQLLGGNTVAPFNPTQRQGQQLGIDRALGGGGFIPAAQEQLLRTAQGVDPRTLFGEMMPQFGGLDFLPEASLAALSGTATGNAVPNAATDALTRGATGSAIPVEARDAIGRIIQGELLPGSDTLSRTASGDFLFGGDGFNAAVDASVRAATPAILSTFGSAGPGGGTGALAKTALGTAAIDAFARQFGQERNNQLGAAGTLANLGLADRGQQLSSAGLLGDLSLADRGQNLQSAGLLGDLGLASQGLRLSGGSALADVAGGAQNRQLSQMGLLGDLSNAERNRALQAAFGLPAAATADVDILNAIGGQQQGQSQAELSGPIQAQMQMLQAALAGLPIPSLIGQTQTQETPSDPFSSLLGLGLTGMSLFGGGGMFPGALAGLFGGGPSASDLVPFNLGDIRSRRI